MKNIVVAFVLIVSCFVSALPQTPEQKKPETQSEGPRTDTYADDVVRITTNLVQVDAVVTDKDGRPVTDLRADEVEIFEDGKPKPITNFSYINVTPKLTPTPVKTSAKEKDKNKNPTVPVPPVRLRRDQVRRTMALVVDDLGLSKESIYYARNAVRKFVEDEMQPDDLVAVIRTSAGIGALQQFSTDKRQLIAAIEKIRWQPSRRAGLTPFDPITADPFAKDTLITADTVFNNRADVESIEQIREELFTVGTLGAVSYVVRGLDQLPGRKSIVLISDGIRVFDVNDTSRGTRVLNAMRRLTDQANRASVVISTIDARGNQPLLWTAADDPGASAGLGRERDSLTQLSPESIDETTAERRNDFFEGQSGLIYLAQQTGGLVLRNYNDITGGIKKIVEDQKGYYLIGYRPDDDTFKAENESRKFHHLSMKVLRPGNFKVRVRNGFFGFSDDEAELRAKTSPQALMAALASPFAATGIHVRLTSLFANLPKPGSVMRSFLHVRSQDLTFKELPGEWRRAEFDLLAVTFGDEGQPIDQVTTTHAVQIKGKTYERVMRDGITFHLFVPVKKAGAYQLRTAVRDVPSRRVGSATQFIEVPDIGKNRLAMSGVLIVGMPMEAYQHRTSTAATSTEEHLEDTEGQGSVAVRQFRHGDAVEYSFVVYNARLDKATKRPQISTQMRLYRNGEQVFLGKETPLDVSTQADLKRLAAGGALRVPAEMEPGEYVLQIVVTDQLAPPDRRLVHQWIDFEIVK